ncbi:zinc metalloprotease [Aquimarina sp. 2201CG5-10]|uniref:zinc metalloprotease n=1 Tax=Aquimarina callyspongiae TaxID=3098150 RepID=UPI002AB39920|nr:zinc metalloprotease [Aquimarina sp. 2201CG5-10]MDY8135689.1 zinc metalloprotease [Aquimarina sp. 2201CG5-10]
MKSKLKLTLVLCVSILWGCSNDDNITIDLPVSENEIITIPVVIHVINNIERPFNISDAKIRSQIDVLNQDFRKKNPDHQKTPDEFKPFIADVGIEFKITTKDPSGNPTSGIIRTESTVTGFHGMSGVGSDIPVEELPLYFDDQGGQNAWPSDNYLNIWIADMTDRLGNIPLPGYANPVNADPRMDGVVIDPRVFGTIEPLLSGHKLGRTVTHEIGHWLNLIHIFAGQTSCETSDLVDDTPTQYSSYGGHPQYPQSSCGSNDMHMNFMDYVNDDSMYMFTKGQKQRMRNVFYPDNPRRALYLNISKLSTSS